MRLNLTLSPSTQPVSFNHLHHLTGTLHKWLGPENDYHDGLSLYSFGWLQGGQVEDGHLTFSEGARWRISLHDEAAAQEVQNGILQDPGVFSGMRVMEARAQTTPRFSDRYLFKVDSPVITRRRRDDSSREYLIFDDERADRALTQTLRAKMRTAGLAGADAVRVRFDRGYDGARTKLATIKKGGHAIKHKGSLCPVIVEGSSEAVQFAWNVGVGELTGSGFGALK
jgi:CRISPR-associated endoribonuclease Cas6